MFAVSVQAFVRPVLYRPDILKKVVPKRFRIVLNVLCVRTYNDDDHADYVRTNVHTYVRTYIHTYMGACEQHTLGG